MPDDKLMIFKMVGTNITNNSVCFDAHTSFVKLSREGCQTIISLNAPININNRGIRWGFRNCALNHVPDELNLLFARNHELNGRRNLRLVAVALALLLCQISI